MKMVFGGKFRIRRSNSKASYLPRQSLEKLNNTDPDHGIYKLTLTSNEDLVAHHKPSYELLGGGGVGGKLPNNLPDVLPLGVKLQQQSKPILKPMPGSPNGLNAEVPLRYGSNNNLATHSPTSATPTPTPYTMIYQTAAHQRYSTPTMGGHKSPSAKSPSGLGQHYTRSQSYDQSHSQHQQQHQSQPQSPTQQQQQHFMSAQSQSHVDLKQTAFDLETTLEEVLPETPSQLSPAQSDCSLSSSGNASAQEAEAHLFRAELISTTLATPPTSQAKPPAMNRQESLRENIEKITQLQSKLMSAHLCDSVGLLGGVKLASPSPQSKAEAKQPPQLPPQSPPQAMPQSPPVEIEDGCLQLLQRSELILLVNPPSTVEIGCQTDDLPDCDLALHSGGGGREDPPTRTTLQPRQLQTIEVDYANLTQELLLLLAPNDKLIDILTPRICKPTTQYVSNLYNPNVPLRPAKRDVGTSTLMRMKASSSVALESKLELQLTDLDSSLLLLNGNGDAESTNLIKQKLDELIKRLNQKIGALRREKQTICEECAANDQVGVDLLEKLTVKVRPSEASKFRTYIDDVGHITSLLLSLSERLGQTESSLEARAQASDQERATLQTKRDRLFEQLEEAQRLKADIDRRGSSIAALFGKHLSADECADYDYFINIKAKLIADKRDLTDKIKGSEEQLTALHDALVQSDC